MKNSWVKRVLSQLVMMIGLLVFGMGAQAQSEDGSLRCVGPVWGYRPTCGPLDIEQDNREHYVDRAACILKLESITPTGPSSPCGTKGIYFYQVGLYQTDIYNKTEDQSCPIKNPTLPATGTKVHEETHYQGTGKDALVWQWGYRSRYSAWQVQGQGQWTHSYGQRLITATSEGRVFALRPSGAVHTYDTTSGPPWRSGDSANELVIEKDGSGQVSGYQLKVAQDDSTEYYDATGRLLKIESRNGWQQHLSYDGQGRLVSISNAAGRQLSLSYNAQGDIASMTAPGGEVTQYEWNAQHQLTATVWPDGTRKQYHYEDPRFNGYLTGITDELGTRISRYEYTPQGEVAHTLNALGQTRNRFAYQWQRTPAGLQSRTTLTDGATGTQQTLQFNRNNGERALRFTAVVQADGNITQATERNPQGQPTRQVNADGSVTFYTYNARGLEIERAQFNATFATATTRPALVQATQVTSTRWHGQWNLPKEVAQPQLTTSYTYNARGDVTGYSTQATTDPTGAQKFEAIGTGPINAMGYGYNANAQLARIVQLQNGVETARWTLGYNEQGDVQRITHTDATTATETTQRIPQHDAHGRPEVIVAPDGSRTRLIYNQRGALTRLVQGEQITHFTYDARGVMTRIKTPDGSVFALVYDSDVNLTQVKHNGKAITTDYVLGLTSDTRTTVDALRFALPRLFPDADFSAYLRDASRQQPNALRREQPRFLPALAPQFTRLAFGFALKFAIDYWSKHSTPDRSASPNRTAKQAADPSYCPTPGYGDTQPKPPIGPLIYPPLPEDDKSDSTTTTPGNNLSQPTDTGGNQIKIPSSGSNVTFIPMLLQHWKDLIVQSTAQNGNQASGDSTPPVDSKFEFNDGKTTVKPLSKNTDPKLNVHDMRNHPVIASNLQARKDKDSVTIGAGKVTYTENGEQKTAYIFGTTGWRQNGDSNIEINGQRYTVVKTDSGSLKPNNADKGKTNANHVEMKMGSYVKDNYSNVGPVKFEMAIENTSETTVGMCLGCQQSIPNLAKENPNFETTVYHGSTGKNP
jgi:YD repeat-containing protein